MDEYRNMAVRTGVDVRVSTGVIQCRCATLILTFKNAACNFIHAPFNNLSSHEIRGHTASILVVLLTHDHLSQGG